MRDDSHGYVYVEWRGASPRRLKNAIAVALKNRGETRADRQLVLDLELGDLGIAVLDNDSYQGLAPGGFMSENPGKPGLPAIIAAVPTLLNGEVRQGPAPEDVAGSFAINTRRAYAADWDDFARWCAYHQIAPLPASPAIVAAFLKDLAQRVKMATVNRRLAGIVQIHKLAGCPINRDDPALAYTLRSLARQHGLAVEGRQALMTEDIDLVLRNLPRNLMGVRDRAILLLGFAGGFRRAELAALLADDLEWRRNGIAVTVRRSKGDQEGRGQLVGILYGAKDKTCPVRALKAWLDKARIAEGVIFRQVRGDVVLARPLSGDGICRVVKRSADRAGIDAKRIGAHSLRVGHVTQASENGGALTDIQRQVRHKRLETTASYVRSSDLFRRNSSGKLGL